MNCSLHGGHLRSLTPKQAAHSSRAMYLSLSASHSSKKRLVQCSMGMRGARRGDSSVWVRYLQGDAQRHTQTHTSRRCQETENDRGCERLKWRLVPVDGVLVQLAELPVHGEDVHVVVLLEVVGQQVQRVFAGLQPLLVLVDFLHLKHFQQIIVRNTKIRSMSSSDFLLGIQLNESKKLTCFPSINNLKYI